MTGLPDYIDSSAVKSPRLGGRTRDVVFIVSLNSLPSRREPISERNHFSDNNL